MLNLLSCAPDQFRLNQMMGRNMIGCKIMSNIDSVEKISDNAIKIKSGGIVGMKVIGMTQHESDFTFKLIKGDGIKFAYRTTVNHYYDQSSLNIELSQNGILISENGQEVFRAADIRIKTGNKYRLRCVNEGKNLKVYLDCDEITTITTNLPATEFVIAETHKNSEVELEGIDVINILE